MAAAVPLAGGRVFLPIFKHDAPDGAAPTIAVITLHGAGRNGDNYHGWVTNALRKQDMEGEIVTISPIFPDKNCSAADWTGDPEAVGRAARWTHSTRQWVNGATSDGFDDWDGISSFEAVDDLITWVEMTYRTIRKIVVTGFSAGAQMGLRWVITSPNGARGVTLSGTLLTIILGSPSSFIYLNDRRPAKSCSLIKDQVVDHNCTTFLVPGSSHKAVKTCKGHYNLYGFGLEGLERGAAKPHTTRADVSDYIHKYLHDDALIEDTLRARFGTKNVIFEFGDLDVKDCLSGVCADDCGAMDEGTSRLQRGLNYMDHLRDALPGYEPQYEIFEGGHRPELFFAGERFNKVVFDKTGWEECLWDSLTCWSLIMQSICGAVAFVCGGTGTGIFCCWKRSRDEVHLHLKYQKELQAAILKVEDGFAGMGKEEDIDRSSSCGTRGPCCAFGGKR